MNPFELQKYIKGMAPDEDFYLLMPFYATFGEDVSIPGTPIYEQMKNEGRLLTEDWSYYNGKTKVAFKPKNMTAEELFEAYMRFRKEFYSTLSIVKRILVSRTNILHNLIINIGYKLSLTYYPAERYKKQINAKTITE